MPRSYQVTPGILGRRRATQPKKVRPTADSMEKSQPAADREPSRPHRTPPPNTPQPLTDRESSSPAATRKQGTGSRLLRASGGPVLGGFVVRTQMRHDS